MGIEAVADVPASARLRPSSCRPAHLLGPGGLFSARFRASRPWVAIRVDLAVGGLLSRGAEERAGTGTARWALGTTIVGPLGMVDRSAYTSDSGAKVSLGEGSDRTMELLEILILSMPLLGAVLPLLVTQISKDAELKAIGLAVIKYAVVLPATLVFVIFSLAEFVF